MNDEIKEILYNPKIIMLSYGNFILLDDYIKLKDYITNLQQENERLNKENTYLDELRNANYLSWQDSLSRIEKVVEELELWQPKIESLKLEKEYLLNILKENSNEII